MVECYGATRPQNGAKVNEDTFAIVRGAVTWAAVCDGAGNAGQVARRPGHILASPFTHLSGARGVAHIEFG